MLWSRLGWPPPSIFFRGTCAPGLEFQMVHFQLAWGKPQTAGKKRGASWSFGSFASICRNDVAVSLGFQGSRFHHSKCMPMCSGHFSAGGLDHDMCEVPGPPHAHGVQRGLHLPRQAEERGAGGLADFRRRRGFRGLCEANGNNPCGRETRKAELVCG